MTKLKCSHIYETKCGSTITPRLSCHNEWGIPEIDIHLTPLIAQLIYEEGWRRTAYPDSKRIITIGYGHNLEAHPRYRDGSLIPKTLTQARGLKLLYQDLEEIARQFLEKNTFVMNFDTPTIHALLNMAYQLGPNFLTAPNGFKKMRSSLLSNDFVSAAMHARDSAWAKQTPERARRVTGQLGSNKIYRIPHPRDSAEGLDPTTYFLSLRSALPEKL